MKIPYPEDEHKENPPVRKIHTSTKEILLRCSHPIASLILDWRTLTHALSSLRFNSFFIIWTQFQRTLSLCGWRKNSYYVRTGVFTLSYHILIRSDSYAHRSNFFKLPQFAGYSKSFHSFVGAVPWIVAIFWNWDSYSHTKMSSVCSPLFSPYNGEGIVRQRQKNGYSIFFSAESVFPAWRMGRCLVGLLPHRTSHPSSPFKVLRSN